VNTEMGVDLEADFAGEGEEGHLLYLWVERVMAMME
jgi:hypothetical protein